MFRKEGLQKVSVNSLLFDEPDIFNSYICIRMLFLNELK